MRSRGKKLPLPSGERYEKVVGADYLTGKKVAQFIPAKFKRGTPEHAKALHKQVSHMADHADTSLKPWYTKD